MKRKDYLSKIKKGFRTSRVVAFWGLGNVVKQLWPENGLKTKINHG